MAPQSKDWIYENATPDDVFKIIGRTKALPMLEALRERRRTHEDLMHSLRINPGVTRRSLIEFRALGLVERDDRTYTITAKGRRVIELATALKEEVRK